SVGGSSPPPPPPPPPPGGGGGERGFRAPPPPGGGGGGGGGAGVFFLKPLVGFPLGFGRLPRRPRGRGPPRRPPPPAPPPRPAPCQQLARSRRPRAVVLQQVVQARPHHRNLLAAQRPGQQPPRQEVELVLDLRPALLQGQLGQVPGCLHELHVVERDQGLQRGVGALAADRAGLAVGGVEDVHRRGRRGPRPERVQAAAVQ